MKYDEVDRTQLAPMMAKYMELKDDYKDTIIFYRLGDFYEMFFDDAILASRELELTLTGRNAGLNERVPMCGVPHHSYLQYANRLVERGYKVAICEQLTDPKESKGMVERGITQIITKGTILDNLLNEKDNNYIASIYTINNIYYISYADISTGKIYTEKTLDIESVYRTIINKNIKELIASSQTPRELLYNLKSKYNITLTITDDLEENEYKYIYKNINDYGQILSLKHLIKYVKDTKKGDLSYLEEVKVISQKDYLLFDIHTKKNLELTQSIRNNDRQYSLLWLLDKTKTAMGSRYLKYNIESPLTNKEEIIRRYNIIDKLIKEFINREELIKLLDNVYDIERLISRISYGNTTPKDMLQLLKSIEILPKIKQILNNIHYDKDIETLDDLTILLKTSINEDAPFTIKEGDIIKDGYNKELDELKSIRKNSKEYILKIENEEKEKTGIKNLKISYNKVFGYYIEISKGNTNLIKEEYGYIRKQTLTTGERYITEELKNIESTILGASEKIYNLEYNLFIEIREKTKTYIKNLQNICEVIKELDMLISFSVISEKNNYIRPIITDENEIEILENRHPVVEVVNKNDYVPNDIIMDKNTNILLITGPNMAGKSTYMRQLAITVIMAQIGCFTPAKYCKIPLFDKIFTRIGASDDLVSGESTFMVEMKEANRAITDATPSSLILFDELGRGTATYDGMALAGSILEYIHDKIKCKTLFSTHYHELTSSSKKLKNLKNVHVEAEETNGKVTFLHKVKEGAIDKSYGINVASLAGLPDSVIKRAEELLNNYELKSNNKKETIIQTSFDFNYNQKENEIIEKIKKINVLELTPLESINKLYEIVEEAKKN